ncbi:MAG: CRISPR-associated endonuclease Cas4g/Cas1g [Thermoanaerobaculia bacterium]
MTIVTDVETPTAAVPEVIPARMLNEFVYCPRLAWLEWVQGEWADNSDTVEGDHAHRRVAEPEGPRARLHQRSIHLTSEKLGLTAVIDLVESDGNRARPVEYKKGRKPQVAGGAWEPERVQLCVQGLLLREHGYECHEGVVYYAASRERVRIRFTPDLVHATLAHAALMRETFSSGRIPAPLEDSPKCPRCSLVSICLPEEVNFLRSRCHEPRPIAVSDNAAYPLVVQDARAYVRLCGSRLRVMVDDEESASVPLMRVSQLVLLSGSHASSAVFRECCRFGIPILHMSGTGWLHGMTIGAAHKNVEIRAEQFAAARDEERRLPIARAIVAAKVHNCRVLLRRNGTAAERDLSILRDYAERAAASPSIEELLGIEGSAAKLYFTNLTSMLKGDAERLGAFAFEARSKRPPEDPMNALLSFCYSLLTRDWTVALMTVGLDPMMGFYHRPRYGKPALALDMMEPFRPVIAESVALMAVNNGEVGERDFYAREGGVLLAPGGRKSLIECYERRMATEIEHPLFGYKVAYRSIFELEARLLARHLLGEIPAYEPFLIR